MLASMKTTAEKIKALRRQHALTQEDLAGRSGVGIATIQRAESGKTLAADSLASIAAAFDIPAIELAADGDATFEPYVPLTAMTTGRILITLLLSARRIHFEFCELDDLVDAHAIEAFHDFANSIAALEVPLSPIALVRRDLEARDHLAALQASGFQVGGADFTVMISEVDDGEGAGMPILMAQWEERHVALAVGRDVDDVARAHVLRHLDKYEAVQGDAVVYPPSKVEDVEWTELFNAMTPDSANA